jgi:hypothetical protein
LKNRSHLVLTDKKEIPAVNKKEKEWLYSFIASLTIKELMSLYF